MRDTFEVDSFDFDVILDFLLLDRTAALEHRDLLDVPFTYRFVRSPLPTKLWISTTLPSLIALRLMGK